MTHKTEYSQKVIDSWEDYMGANVPYEKIEEHFVMEYETYSDIEEYILDMFYEGELIPHRLLGYIDEAKVIRDYLMDYYIDADRNVLWHG